MSNFYKFTHDISFADVQKEAENIARNKGYNWNNSASTVLYYSCQEVLAPNFKGNINSPYDAITKWVDNYYSDFNNRPSQRKSNPPKTQHDPAMDILLQGRLSNLDSKALRHIKWAHRASMSAENILGLLIEEYLSIRLKDYGWHCAWGATLKAVDFVSDKGELLQVKSRSNTENSSSNKIRNGTEIKKWWRFHAQKGITNWDKLNQLLSINCLSEDDFQSFVEKTVRANPSLIAIEKENTWNNYI